MCLIVFDWQEKQHLYLSANRDEFYARAAAPLAQWQDAPTIYAGRDLTQGGTWLGANNKHQFAALTNVRALNAGPNNPPSRGQLIPSFLTHADTIASWAQSAATTAAQYAPFNLIFGDVQQLWYLTNYPEVQLKPLSSGLYALSNAQLDSPWPKAELAKKQLSDWMNSNKNPEALAQLLSRRETYSDEQLPNTGVSQEWERLLSAQFIISPSYGTRCSTGLKISPTQAILSELTWNESGEQTNSQHLRL